jgi:hypothetical protein
VINVPNIVAHTCHLHSLVPSLQDYGGVKKATKFKHCTAALRNKESEAVVNILVPFSS